MKRVCHNLFVRPLTFEKAVLNQAPEKDERKSFELAYKLTSPGNNIMLDLVLTRHFEKANRGLEKTAASTRRVRFVADQEKNYGRRSFCQSFEDPHLQPRSGPLELVVYLK